MNELKQKNKNNIEKVSFILSECNDNQDLPNKTKIKLSDIGTLSELVKAGIQTAGNMAGKGGTGLYYVNTYGGKLCFSSTKNAYIGATFLKNGDLAQAALNPVVFNPIDLCSSISNIALQMKLNEISKKIDKVLKCFEENDKASLKGGLKKLIDIMQKYEDRKNDETLINNDVSRVYKYSDLADDIKIKYIDKIQDMLNNPSKWSNKKAFDDMKKYFNIVWQSMTLQGLAVYMVTILERKFDDKYLQKVKNNLQNEYDEVLNLYDKCISFIKEHIDKDWYEKLGDFLDFSSEQIFILSDGLIGKGIAKAIELTHKNIRNNEREKYYEYFDDKGRPSHFEYVDKIDNLNEFYNQPINLLVDNEYLYL
jgi:hypothetical protein